MRLFFICSLLVLLNFYTGCTGTVEKPEKGTDAYRSVVSDFYVSLAAIQSDQAIFAIEKMEEVANRYPAEAAAWANLGVYAMRQGNFELAEKHLKEALNHAEQNPEIVFLAGVLESRRGNVDASIAYLRKAIELNPENPMIAYALAQELERQDEENNAEEVSSILESIHEKQSDNLAVLLELVRTSVKWDNEVLLGKALDALEEKSSNWPEEVVRQYQELQQTIRDGEDNLTFQLAFLQNSLNQLPQFQADLAAIQLPPNQVGFLISQFTWLPQPTTSVAEADTGLSFKPETREYVDQGRIAVTAAFSDEMEADRLVVGSGIATINNELELNFPGEPHSKYGVATLDYNYDFWNDLAFAGSDGFSFYRQQEDSTFADITSEFDLSSSVVNDSYLGLWSRDIDLDGDLDIVLSRQNGSTLVLQNKGDGTFGTTQWFSQVVAPLNFEWADLDGDADSDAVFIDAEGNISLLLNERGLNFIAVPQLPQSSGAYDIEVADIDNDGNIDLLVWNGSGIHQIHFDHETGGWKQKQLVTLDSDSAPDTEMISQMHLYAMDIDNNGANDLVISHPDYSGFWLNSEVLQFIKRMYELPSHIQDIADLNGDTRLDLIGINSGGIPYEAVNTGAKNYLARIIRPQASGPMGDQRINSFGIGGEIEIRSGLLYQKQLIKQPWVHLGLGSYEEAELLRIIWPNGSSQAEFAELGYGTKIFNEQILKGSCPWLFAYNGEQMEFVTDFIWRSPLGLRINAQATAGVVQTEDRVKISGSRLKEKNGYYELRITADLWETHFFDHISLMAVDHPEQNEIYVDERFSVPPPDLSVRTTAQPKPVASVTDQEGRDVTQKISEKDGTYLRAFQKTKYQGVAQEHFVEVNLGEEAADLEKLWLLAHGWVRPTDSSINVALSQGSNRSPRGIAVAVPDGVGGWQEVYENLGFPAGKAKTVMIDLENIFPEGVEKRLRLYTTTETYWDHIQWAEKRNDLQPKKQMLDSQRMELRYRGFSRVIVGDENTPDLPDYQTISGTTQKWFDLEGYYTRFGDVSELLEKVDDRYVIMNAGDEMVLRFKAPPLPEQGMKRDFVLIGDGWVKDGDYNTKFSKTVLPLPSHEIDQYQYDQAPKSLADDPIYQKHKEDWVKYHTRYITPRSYRTALNFD